MKYFSDNERPILGRNPFVRFHPTFCVHTVTRSMLIAGIPTPLRFVVKSFGCEKTCCPRSFVRTSPSKVIIHCFSYRRKLGVTIGFMRESRRTAMVSSSYIVSRYLPVILGSKLLNINFMGAPLNDKSTGRYKISPIG